MVRVYGAVSGGGSGGMSLWRLAKATPLMKLHLVDTYPEHLGLAGAGVQRHQLRLRILLSYHYYGDVDLDALFAKHFSEPYPEVFLDSGAFSAHSQGASIDLPAYAAYIKRFSHWFTTYASLDVIGDPLATRANQQRLEDMGLSPIPVFHGGSPWDELERYLEHYPYIALGGLVGKINGALPWLVRCFKLARGRAVYHGFGVTQWQVLKALPWYSVDSSSWGQGFRYGAVPVFDPQRGRFVKLTLGKRREWMQHAALVRSLGFDPADFADRARNDRAKICAISALSYMLAEQWLRKRHGEITIPDRGGEPGVRMYLADANPARFGEAEAGAR